jgi:hypothetical protein
VQMAAPVWKLLDQPSYLVTCVAKSPVHTSPDTDHPAILRFFPQHRQVNAK